MAGPSRGLDDYVEMAVPSPVGGVKIVSPINAFVLNTLTLQKKKSVFFFLTFESVMKSKSVTIQ